MVTAKPPMWSGRPVSLRRDEVAERAARLVVRPCSLCWRRKWKRSSTVRARLVGVELDVVAHRVGREQAVDAARREQLLRDDRSSSALPSAKIWRACSPYFSCSRMRGIDALELPGVEERRPVDVLAQRREREVVEHAHAGELGRRRRPRRATRSASGSRAPPRARRSLCFGARVELAQLLVLGAVLRDEGRLALVAEQAGRDRARRGWRRARARPARCSAARSSPRCARGWWSRRR